MSRYLNGLAGGGLATKHIEVTVCVSLDANLETYLPPESSNGFITVTPEKLERLNFALNELPPLCRRVFILVRYEGKNFDEVAAQLGLSPRKVRRLVQRAFAKLERALRS